MMRLSDTTRAAVGRIAAKHSVVSVRVFGSTVRGEETSGSDLDLLVELAPGHSLLDLVAFWQDIEEELGRQVDVVTEGGLSPYLRERILGEARPL